MTGNLSRDQAQALHPILRGEKTTTKRNYSELCLPRMIVHVQSQA